MSDTSDSNNLVQKYIKGIQEFYPGFQFSSSTGFDSAPYELELSFNAQTIGNTEYELSDNNYLIHYTSSIQNVIEILYSGNLRLMNLISLNDPQEINFIINHLKLESYKSYIENFKSTYFSASFCKVERYNEADAFPMWRLYGGNGFGCAIVFELEKHESHWIDFIVAQMQYGDCESLERFNNFIKFHNSFKGKYNFPMNVPITFPALMAFHKNKIWSYEKEIRLLTYQDYDEYTFKRISDTVCDLKHSIDKNNKGYSYVELPLKGGEKYNEIKGRGLSHTLNRLIPILKIKKIILGYQIKTEFLYDIERLVGYISNDIYGYKIEVESSHLTKYMV